jgi:hypothetical protein
MSEALSLGLILETLMVAKKVVVIDLTPEIVVYLINIFLIQVVICDI